MELLRAEADKVSPGGPWRLLIFWEVSLDWTTIVSSVTRPGRLVTWVSFGVGTREAGVRRDLLPEMDGGSVGRWSGG